MGLNNWGDPGRASVLVDGAFGSTGKGLISAWLAENYLPREEAFLATTNAGAQAGHTTEYASGRKFVCFHLPTSVVVRENSHAYINAGSIIDLDVLRQEIIDCKVSADRVTIHPRAALITEEDRAIERAREAGTTRSGSTQKGVGSALSRKIMRTGTLVSDSAEACRNFRVSKLDLNDIIRNEGERVIVEVPQGFGLSINHGFRYPYVTSRDCWVGSALSDAGIHPMFIGSVCMVVRTHPIRVGSIFNELGEKLGDSGPFYTDAVELDWEKDLSWVTPERTTVTKRVRRVSTWSWYMYAEALSLNRPDIVALTFCDYMRNTAHFLSLYERMLYMEKRMGLNPDHIFSCGPRVEDVYMDHMQVVDWLKGRGDRA